MRRAAWRESKWACATVLVLLIVFSKPAAAAPQPDQIAKSKIVAAQLKKAGNLYRAKKIKESAAAFRDAQAAFAELLATGDPQNVLPLANPLRSNMEKAQQLLELEGQKFDALPKLPEAASPNKNNGPTAIPASGQISFVRQVAPLLISKCGGCHVNQARGGLSLSTFAGLQKGSKDGGIIVQPGSSRGSRIVEVIQSGDMPRGGGKVSADELALLAKWIDEGAKFDGSDINAAIGNAPVAQPEKPVAMLKAVQATGNEDVLFARDVGPVIVANCLGCHGTNNPRGQLSLASFNGILKGGDSGAIVVPGKAADSLLIQKLRGTAGARMPLNRPALDAETIAKIEKWIAGGAKYDGPDPAMATEDVVQLLFAARSTHEELSVSRKKTADRTWKLTLPDAEPNVHESENFLVVGNMGEELIADVSQTAETLAPRIAKMLGAPTDRPLIKGRLTIFAFNKRYDYGEIGTMVESRELPVGSRGHWRFTGIDAYAGIVPPRAGDTQPLDSLLAQQIAGAYVASLGKVPHWFAEGTGRVTAARINPKDPRIKAWEARLTEVIKLGGKGDVAVNGRLPGEDGDVAAYGFIRDLSANRGKFSSLLIALRAGTAFDVAFVANYGGSPAQVAGSWLPKGLKGYR